eukprot:4001426-Alexandrium_andersonii.AAC.1
MATNEMKQLMAVLSCLRQFRVSVARLCGRSTCSCLSPCYRCRFEAAFSECLAISGSAGAPQ